MRNYKKHFMIALVAVSAIYGCRKAYVPEATMQNPQYLVVDGVVNTGLDSTVITLSRTVRLSEGTGTNPELNAHVSIQSEDGTFDYDLEEISKGRYVAPYLGLDVTKKYRVNIRTSGGKQYVSAYEPVVKTPVIDSVGYTLKQDELQVNINTHDANNNTRYYRWDYEETWEFNANYRSFFKSNGDTVLERDMVNDDIYHCWTSTRSNTLLLGSSAKLTNDVIKDVPLLFIPASSEKIGLKYSIFVRQYALTKEAFEFWQNIKKNTEQLGSIFDPQPSQIRGNIRNLNDPAEIVIGYFSVANITRTRSFISKARLNQYRTLPFYNDCRQDSILLARKIPLGPIINEENLYFNKNRGATSILLPTIAVVSGTSIEGHMGTLPKCADCTLRGTKRKPAFWQ